MESRTRLAYGPAHLTLTFRYMDGWVSRGMENRFRGSQEKNCSSFQIIIKKKLSSWSFNLKNKTYVANKKKFHLFLTLLQNRAKIPLSES